MRAFIFIVFMFVLILTHQAIAQSWWNVGSAGFSENTITEISIAIDGSGTPYAAYSDFGEGEDATFKAIVKKYNGSSWVDVGSPCFSATGADDILIAIDESGIPYVAYINADTYQANVMKFNAGNWELVGPPDFSADEVYDISFAIYGSTPYVAYSDYYVEDKATVMRFNGSNWENVGVMGFTDTDIFNTSFAIAGDGTPYIAYQDGIDEKANVMKFDGSDWVIVGSPNFSPHEASDISLAIDGSGTPYVAYSDGTEELNKVSVMKYSEGNWTNVGLAGFSAGEAFYTSLAIDGSGTPYVVYKDYVNGSKATVMRYKDSNWENVGSAGFTAGEVYYTSLKISPNNIPVVAYLDVAIESKATVMKYSAAQADPLPVELSLFTASVVGSSTVLKWRTATEVDNYGFSIERTGESVKGGNGDWIEIGFVQGNGNSNSPKDYSFIDANPPSGNLKYRLKQIDTDGKFEYYGTIAEITLSPTGVNEKESPEDYALLQNYPNPFNPSTNFEFRIRDFGFVQLKVYDVLGNEVSTLVNENKEPGEYNIKFDGSNLSSGIYYYQLKCNRFVETKKFMLMK